MPPLSHVQRCLGVGSTLSFGMSWVCTSLLLVCTDGSSWNEVPSGTAGGGGG